MKTLVPGLQESPAGTAKVFIFLFIYLFGFLGGRGEGGCRRDQAAHQSLIRKDEKLILLLVFSVLETQTCQSVKACRLK